MNTRTGFNGLDISTLKQINSKAVVDLVRMHGPVGRKKIVQLTGLPARTIYRLTNDLVQNGIISEIPRTGADNVRGRKGVVLDINNNGCWILALNVGTDHVTAAAINPAGEIGTQISRSLANLRGEQAVFPVILHAITKLLKKLEPTRGKPMAVGVSHTGIIDSDHGVVKLSLALGIENYQFERVIREILGVPVVLRNDVEASALAEAKIGFGSENPNFVYMRIEDGFGGCLVSDREIVRYGNRNELGMMVVAPNEDPYGTDNRGFLGWIASGRSITAAALSSINSGVESTLSERHLADPESITDKVVMDAARNGDKLACDIMSRVGNYLGIGVANISNMFGVSLFVMDGYIWKRSDLFMDSFKNSLEKFAYWPWDIRFETSNLGDNAATLGAGLVALDKMFSSLE